MSGEVGALGELVNAGLAARALDRAPASDRHAAHGACANCGAALHGHFCHDCGQKAHLHRSLLEVAEEFLHGITHFDSKTWRTLPMLVTRPGQLTWNYIHGHRARYIAPVPLFLLVVFLMFFVLSFVQVKIPNSELADMTPAQARAELSKIETAIAELDRDIAAAVAKADDSAEVTLETTRAGFEVRRDLLKRIIDGKPVDSDASFTDDIKHALERGDLKVNLGDRSLNAKALKALKNPDLTLYKIQGKAYKLSFLLVPLSLPTLWLLFALRRGVHLYDHAVFALYSISFMSLLFIIGSVALALDVTTGWFWTLLVIVAPLTHMFFQLRGAYRLTAWGAWWRTWVLGFAAAMTLGLYLLLMLVIGVID